jgi:redox-sensitive bicupin YhaK (pirin superfamily)
MVAGRGIEHAERPAPGMLHGLQLWARLPPASQLRLPAYMNIDASAIPEFTIGAARVRLVSGTLGGQTGPGMPDSPSLLAHLSLAAAGEAFFEADPGHELGVYVAAGSAAIADAGPAPAGRLVVLEQSAGQVRVVAGAGGAELIVLGGAPAEQPLVFHGPFVMDSLAAVRQAESDYRAGRMGFLER